MKNCFKAGLSLGLTLSVIVNSGLVAATEAVKSKVKVPVGTSVILSLLETISSKTAQVGQKVRFSIVSDVIVDDKIVIKKGAVATGEITAAGAAGMAGTAGSLTVNLQLIEGADGSMIPISATKGAKGESRLAQSVAITALCCIFAIFMKGKDVTFEQGSTYSGYTIAPVEVKVE